MRNIALKLLILFGLLLELINPMTPFVRVDPLQSKQPHLSAQLKLISDITDIPDSLPNDPETEDDEDSIIDAHASTLAEPATFCCRTTVLSFIVFPEQTHYAEGLSRQALQPPIAFRPHILNHS